ncbi:unnamed protein product [Somion occarium]|uniref:PUB domain-containing protein n=1 Tax=Somion occarium TaxID=3059160 RepID=A0ABP1D187_9APHY
MDVDNQHELSSETQDFQASTSHSMPTPDRATVARALEQRLRQEREEASAHGAHFVAFDEHHEKRQEFRRLIDPGILRPNPRHVALESLDILLKLAENIIKHPDEDKYLRFKPTNAKIKQYLVDPKGTLEYAVALGFRPQVENFQPYYAFNKRKTVDLQIGAAILKEALELETAKEEAAHLAKQREKAIADAAVAKVKQAFIDDRKSKAWHDRREQEILSARAARRTSVPTSPSPPATARMPGSGHTISDD